ncbi:hypothetical protein [Parapusillimonas granuli]|uniref:Uncharacterized protein n=1 Tax=Parapusillimonas granuli TaxID=380911 RepID=A0A853G1S9_9BURK|nr:hypothetical protein [Parapusillimonas granuli]MBB5216987.1 hypothetical protein [Parapusillimonas granuli]MEB2400683.1 hypothetical protein [Alcaligenaceae bacterium]NYT50249.1 hypothetical protein [Parapusillimonas granuli]
MAAALITDLSVYTTRSGRVAFLHTRENAGQKTVFYGYILELSEGKAVRRELAWTECGTCISSNEEGDRIVWKA